MKHQEDTPQKEGWCEVAGVPIMADLPGVPCLERQLSRSSGSSRKENLPPIYAMQVAIDPSMSLPEDVVEEGRTSAFAAVYAHQTPKEVAMAFCQRRGIQDSARDFCLNLESVLDGMDRCVGPCRLIDHIDVEKIKGEAWSLSQDRGSKRETPPLMESLVTINQEQFLNQEHEDKVIGNGFFENREKGLGVIGGGSTWDPWVIDIDGGVRDSETEVNGRRVYFLFQAPGDIEEGTEFWAFSRLGTAFRPTAREPSARESRGENRWEKLQEVRFKGWEVSPVTLKPHPGSDL